MKFDKLFSLLNKEKCNMNVSFKMSVELENHLLERGDLSSIIEREMSREMVKLMLNEHKDKITQDVNFEQNYTEWKLNLFVFEKLSLTHLLEETICLMSDEDILEVRNRNPNIKPYHDQIHL